jgi:hypothetical protein
MSRSESNLRTLVPRGVVYVLLQIISTDLSQTRATFRITCDALIAYTISDVLYISES